MAFQWPEISYLMAISIIIGLPSMTQIAIKCWENPTPYITLYISDDTWICFK